MKNILTSSLFIAVALAIGVTAARADDIVIAKVPFPFVANGKQFAAGRYRLDEAAGVLSLKSLDDRSMVVALTRPADKQDPAGDQPVLVFQRFENEYVLSQVWESRDDGAALAQQTPGPRVAQATPDAGSTTMILASIGR